MLFNTLSFFVFLAAALTGYHAIRRSLRAQNVFLLAMSYVFYGMWDVRFCSLLALSTVVDFFCARAMNTADDGRRRRALLGVSLATNLGILGFFKYFDFFAGSATALLEAAGLRADAATLDLVLPVGISFYTFQTLAYTIDVYRRRTKPTSDFTAFALYVSFFPQLVAGPIERASRLLPQLTAPRRVTTRHVNEGIVLIIQGLVKKVAIADVVAPHVETAFAGAPTSSTVALVGVYLFALQLYGDFCGYSNIAQGTARLFGIDIMNNFSQPYFSQSFREFWNRWHISLSSWLRDYLYIPLGGSRHGAARTLTSLMVTMVLGGLWHGASWTFVAWGTLHGLYLAVEHVLVRRRGAEPSPGLLWPFAALGRGMFVFHLWCLSLVFFRASSFETVGTVFRSLVTGGWEPARGATVCLAYSAALLLLIDIPQYRANDHLSLARRPIGLRYAALAPSLALVLVLWRTDYVPFIYFQF